MTITVEDGSGLADADAYISVADANAYHAAQGNADWAGDDATKEIAIRRATAYLDTRYTWSANPLTATQALAWPRDNAAWVWPVARVVKACAELALRALAAPLYTDTDDSVIKSEKVGPIAIEYLGGRQNSGQTNYTIVRDLIAPYVGGGRRTIRIERAS